MQLSLSHVALLTILASTTLPVLTTQDGSDVVPGHATSSNNADEVEEDENDVTLDQTAAEALHDDSLSSLPSLPVELLDLTAAEESDKKSPETENVDSSYTDDFDGEDIEIIEDETLHKLHFTSGITSLPGDGTLNLEENDDADAESDLAKEAARGESAADETVDTKDTLSNDILPLSEQKADESDVVSKSEGVQSSQSAPADKSGEEAETTRKAQESASTANENEEIDGRTKKMVVDYASKLAGAIILESSPSMKGASKLLNSDKDQYAIAPCEDKRFVVVGLSEDILVKEVKLANYERYSSHVKTFQILGSQNMDEWVDLGTYKAQVGNGEQAFTLKEPSWARYLKFHFLTFYGNEHYCTVSQIKVHGSTMLQGFHEQWKESEEETKKLLEEVQGKATSSESAGEGTITDPGRQQNTSAVKETENATISHMETVEAHARNANEDQQIESKTIGGEEEPAISRTATDSSREDQQLPPGKEEHTKATILDEDEGVASPAVHEGDLRALEQVMLSTDEAISHIHDAINIHEVRKRSGGLAYRGYTEEAFVMDWTAWENEENLDFFGEHRSEAICIASFHTSSLRASSSEKMRPEDLSLNAVSDSISSSDNASSYATVTKVMKAAVSAGSDAIKTVKLAPSVSGAVKEIQRMIQKNVGSVDIIEQVVPPMTSGSSSGSQQNDRFTSLLDTQVEVAADEKQSEVAPEDPTEKPSESSEETFRAESDENGSRTDLGIPIDSASLDLGSPSKKSENTVVVDKEVGDDSDLFASALPSQFLSAKCLEGLTFAEFKTKILSARNSAKASPSTASTGDGVASGSGSGKMEPIFKKLTDEIKSLQLNQNVYEQYNKALVSCYQQIVLEMSAEIRSLEHSQNLRLSALENNVKKMMEERDLFPWRSNVMHSIIAFLRVPNNSFEYSADLTEYIEHSKVAIVAGGVVCLVFFVNMLTYIFLRMKSLLLRLGYSSRTKIA